MPWDVKGQHRTLYIRKIAKGKLRVDQFIAVRTNDGVDYLEPMPSETMGLRSMVFDDIVFIEGTVPTQRVDVGQLNLTHTNSDGLSGRV